MTGKVGDMLNAAYSNQRFPWKVSYHVARGFKFQLKEHWLITGKPAAHFTSDFTIDARVCGTAIFKVPWETKLHEVYVNQYGSHPRDYPTDQVKLVFWTFDRDPLVARAAGTAFNLVRYSGLTFNGTPTDFATTADTNFFIDNSVRPPEVKLSITHAAVTPNYSTLNLDTTEQHLSVPLEEDTSCPPLPHYSDYRKYGTGPRAQEAGTEARRYGR
jgi:hypothetical protein